MRLNDAVGAVTGEIFEDGWSRIRGSMQGLYASKQKQMVRAAAGHRAAVFKAIRGGARIINPSCPTSSNTSRQSPPISSTAAGSWMANPSLSAARSKT